MYTKRIRLLDYGPIEQLDITFPFEGDTPRPVIIVGENGSGKSILLSHIVNGLVSAKAVAYPEAPEVDIDKVYKLRSNSYIKSGSEYYFGRVDFEDGLFLEEIRSRNQRQGYETLPTEPSGFDIHDAWNKMNPKENDHFDSSFSPTNKDKVENIFFKRCVLYFPPNRFEEPAWLNEYNLKAQAQYMDLKHIQGQTERKVINYSPLHENQNWLFDVIYDRAAFEIQTSRLNLPVNDSKATLPLSLFSGYSGQATRTYEAVLQIVQTLTRRADVRFGIGRRNNRVVSLTSDLAGQRVPNIFQLSSGETALLNLFLSILRDFDLCGAPFSRAADIKGIVVVDEIDLHLHAVYQHEVLPSLIKMFPKVQFIVTTHSPLFVLGMQKVFGEDGFGLFSLPEGQWISPEEFSEFGDAFRAFAATRTFSDDVRTMIEKSQRPIVFVEGTIDMRYIQKASELLGHAAILEAIDIRDGEGAHNLKKIWKTSRHIDVVTQRTVLLFDCDTRRANENQGNLFQCVLPFQCYNPVETGIENLFNKATLRKAIAHKPAFVDIEREHPATKRGVDILVPEKWSINCNEKTNLANWLCKNGTKEDFEGFGVVFELLEEALDLDTEVSSDAEGHEQLRPGMLQSESVVANLEES